jgi:hypothetical protein
LKTLFFFPFFIKKFENFNKGNSKFLVFNERLFLKQIGISIKLEIKKFIKEWFRKEIKLVTKELSFII